MDSNNKVYQRLDTDRSEASNLPQQGSPSQYPQFMHPQGYYYHHPQLMAPLQPAHSPQRTNQTAQHSNQTAQQSNRAIQLPNPQPTEALAPYPFVQPQPGNSAHLKVFADHHEQEIQKHQKMVRLNGVIIALLTIVGLCGIFLIIGFCSYIDNICDLPEVYDEVTGTYNTTSTYDADRVDCLDYSDDLGTAVLFLGVPIFTVVLCLLISIHKKAIKAYQNRQADVMENVMICYGVLLAMCTASFNIFGMAAYGYLTYSAYQLKTSFNELKKIEALRAADNGNVDQTYQTSQGDFRAVV